MRPARSTTPARSRSAARRGSALLALGAVALVGSAPAALAADDTVTDATAPASDAAAGTTAIATQVLLPSDDQVDQLVPAAVTQDAPADEAPVVQAPADGTADPEPLDGTALPEAPAEEVPVGEPADAAAEEDPAPPTEPELPPFPELPCVEGCYGTGKVSLGVGSETGRDLAGARFELDVVGTGPEPEWAPSTTSFGAVAGYYELGTGESATVRLVAAPAGLMATGPVEWTIGPCGPEDPFDCSYDLRTDLVEAYRVLDVDVQDDEGAAVAGATVELWGTPPEPVEPVVRPLAVAAEPAGLVLLGTATSDAAGRVAFGPRTPGTYELRTTGVPAGWVLPSATQPVALDAVLSATQADVPVVVPLVLAAVPAPAPSVPSTGPVPPAAPVALPAAPAAPAAAVAAPVARPRTDRLAATGAEPGAVGALAAGLVVAGAAAVAAARRPARRR
ncbi:MSCRAMM family protein [Cellulomonas telluris]|uniref:MSCRAMM family protein n=1 Tax=Cellulomonas telluris TaxID=2306636 RepID=UPI001657136D|nr:SpaA isopeptide-forming pilin-related protein [Cellulomonas telluris]